MTSLFGSVYKVGRLGPDRAAGTVTFTSVDAEAGVKVVFHITTSTDGITTSIVGPRGQTINAATVRRTYGGSFHAHKGTNAAASPSILLTLGPGFHQVYTFPSVGAGTYVVHFNAKTAPSSDVAIMVEHQCDSDLSVQLFVTEQVVTVDSGVVLAVAVFESSVAVPQGRVTVTVTVKPPTLPEFTMTLLDDGLNADFEAGDGLFGGAFLAKEAGDYIAMAKIAGAKSNGTPFYREATTQVEVVTDTAVLSQTIACRGEDDSPTNGLFDRLAIEVRDVAISVAGTYVLHVILESVEGETLVAYGQEDLAVGTTTMRATLSAEDILRVNQNGFAIADVHLTHLGSNGAALVSRIIAPDQPDCTFTVAQFERPPIRLTGINSDLGIDDGAPAGFDILRVNVGIDIHRPGRYEYMVGLFDEESNRVQVLRGVHESEGKVETLVLDFSGPAIRKKGVDGPFKIRDLIIYGDGGSMTNSYVYKTQVYLASVFAARSPRSENQKKRTSKADGDRDRPPEQ